MRKKRVFLEDKSETIISVRDNLFYEVRGFLVNNDDFEEYEEEEDDEDDDFLSDLSGHFEFMNCIKVISKETKKPSLGLIIDDPSILLEDNFKNQKNLINDAYLFIELNCPFVVKFLGVNLFNSRLYNSEYDDDDNGPNPALFYEFPKNKNLYYLDENKIKLTPVQRQIIIIGIVSGLYYLHRNHIVHKFLSPKAIFLDENFYPKIFLMNSIIEFGSSINYQAPEQFRDDFEISDYTDVFAIGRLLYYLITGYNPFRMPGDNFKKANGFMLMEAIFKENFPLLPSSMPKNIRQLLKSCWYVNPCDRPTLLQIADLVIFNKDFYIDEIKSDVDFQQINDFIRINDLYSMFHPTFLCKLQIECTKSATIDIELEPEYVKKLDNIIRSKFTCYHKEKAMKLMIEAANDGFFEKHEIMLQKIISYVNKLYNENNELADQFIKIVFGKPIRKIDTISLLKYKSLNIACGISLIGANSFAKYANLVSINIPNSVVEIGCEAFCECPNLKFINIPESIKNKSIGKCAFKNCPKLKCIKTPSKLKIINDETFKGDEGMTKIFLNDGLEIIGKEAFSGCNEVQYIKIPKSVVLIDEKAFNQCKNLKVIIFKGCHPRIGNDAINSNVIKIYDE